MSLGDRQASSPVEPYDTNRGTTLTIRPLQRPDQAVVLDPRTVTRAKLGDIDAFTSIVETYYARSLRFARAMLRHPDDAEDMVQEAFVRLYRALPRYEERQRFESWLFQILGNCCRTANTARHRERTRLVDDAAALERVPSRDNPAERFDHEWGDEVRQALAELPEYNREIFLLHYIEGFSYDEIERMTGVRQSALKMRVKRACDVLRARLSPGMGRR
ncbi:MAG TPA: RNA polymerase sigma factor [Gemmatimonadaceae bacterium]|nr:RNA polymerase sigma factor [Gemmatimonadaceae bacterium]